MKEEREYPRYDIELVPCVKKGFAAVLIDHDTGQTWAFDHQKWIPIPRSGQHSKSVKPKRKT